MGDPGGSRVLLQVGKNGINFAAAQGNGSRALSRAAVLKLSRLSLALPACSSLANPTHMAGACCFPQPCLRRGLR